MIRNHHFIKIRFKVAPIIWLMLACALLVVGCKNNPETNDVISSLSKDIGELRRSVGMVNVPNPKAAALYGDVFELVEKYYLYEYDPDDAYKKTLEGIKFGLGDPDRYSDRELVEIGIKNALESFDRYSTYYDRIAFRELNENVSGEFGGLGVEVKLHALGLEVITSVPNSPADKADLTEGNVIIEADGQRLQGLGLQEIISIIRGPVNTVMRIKVLQISPAEIQARDETELYQMARMIMINREIIMVQSVEARMLEQNQIGYIKISHFNEHSGEELELIITDLLRQHPAMIGWLVDVRDNPGGVFSQALKISDAFLSEGEIIHTVSKGDTEHFAADSTDFSNGLPLIVLINGNSASASEIFAAAIQDLERGSLMGEKSYGKGLVQTLFPLRNGGGVKLTTSEYKTASGFSVGRGLEPDVKLIDNAETPIDEVIEKAKFYLINKQAP